MESMFNVIDTRSKQRGTVEEQLEECQALIRLQHEYIQHLEHGIEVMNGMHAYIVVLEKRLLDLGVDHVDFDGKFFGMPEVKEEEEDV